MKFIVFRTSKPNNRSKSTKKNFGLNFERFLFFSFVCIFMALIMVQAAMFNPTISAFLTKDSSFDGRALQLEEYLYDEGEISIALCDGNSNEDIKVLVNGEEVAAFTDNVVDLKVKDMDVIEIDGSLVEGAEVEVVSTNGNFTENYEGKRVLLNKNVEKLLTVTLEHKE